VSPVKDFPKHVAQVLPRRRLVAFKIVIQHLCAVDQVTHVEAVAAAVAETRAEADANAGSELLPSEEEGVVEAEREEDGGVRHLLVV